MVHTTRKPVLATCKWCDKTFNVRLSRIVAGQAYCSVPCEMAKQQGKQRPTTRRTKTITTPGVDPKHYGALAEVIACEWLIRQGYDLFRNISSHGLVDLIAWKPGEPPVLIDVKGTRTFTRGTVAQRAAGVQMLYVDRATKTVSFNPEDLGRVRRPRDYLAAHLLGVERRKALAELRPDPSSPSPALPGAP